MSVVLYRKYRPQKFGEVVGQDHVVEVLVASLENGKIGHAYLFSGPRGTGKTSVARILACEAGCHEYDMMEIDAASSRGIDDIRLLREGVPTMPLRGKKKAYIIDEAHMLTREAFNALLKTLEEPPEHAMFILATTEPKKLPDTITSRCQHFAFKKQPEDILKKAIKNIAKKESVAIDDEAAALVAFFADGSFRDAFTMLDQLVSMGGKDISGDMARKFLQAPDKKIIDDFVAALVAKDTEKCMAAVRDIVEKGTDVQLFLKFVLREARALLFQKLASPKNHDEKSEKLKRVSVGDLGFILLSLLTAYDNANRAYLPQLPLELAIAKIHLKNQASDKK